ncbi:hypothetical protein RRG08_009134 [Elysia crispata]|uniref:Uncharacterized protein n=1 Tax=Elysia crispata TaxID=231223 RepID=A0AAE0YNV8_9GAST|nr:hypothetical protein RRG08_009134 [Elysia crispata]
MIFDGLIYPSTFQKLKSNCVELLLSSNTSVYSQEQCSIFIATFVFLATKNTDSYPASRQIVDRNVTMIRFNAAVLVTLRLGVASFPQLPFYSNYLSALLLLCGRSP